MTAVSEVVQFADPGAVVELFTLDYSSLTRDEKDVLRFTNYVEDGGAIGFGDETYFPAPIELDGLQWSSSGQIPRPTLRVGNLNQALTSIVLDPNTRDLLGAKVTRVLTFERFLDSGAEPDGDKFIENDSFVINRKVSFNPINLEFELAARMDQQGTKLPRRNMYRTFCTHVYRIFNSSTGVCNYTKATCPYTDVLFFKRNGQSTSDPAEDDCGKDPRHCLARFGTDDLPGQFFPGMIVVPGR